MRLLIFLPALLLAITPLLAQDDEATSMLGAADSAGAAVRSAVYDARLINRNVDGKEYVTEAKIYMLRNPADPKVGMKVRIEQKEGTITYDGSRHLWLTPTTKKLWRYDSTFAFANILEGTSQGRLITMLFKPEPPFTALAPMAVTDTPVTIDGVPCRSIRAPWPDDDIQTGKLTRWSFGAEDHLPRHYSYSSIYRGIPYTDTLTISNLRLGMPLPDSLFTMTLPEGFVYDTVRPSKPVELLPAGTTAPDWALTGLDGAPISLAKLRGRVVVLDFWYMACPPCLAAMPALSTIQKRFDTSEVRVVGVNVRDSLAYARRFITSKKLAYSFAFDGADVAKAYHVSGYPTIYVIGRDGTITASHEGYGKDSDKELTGMIERALRQ